jgi:hypothetical protein
MKGETTRQTSKRAKLSINEKKHDAVDCDCKLVI